MKMEERLENVQRIGRANIHKQFKIKTKMDAAAEKGQRTMDEKKKLLENRLKIRQEADTQKREMMEKVEKMKLRGNFDKTELSKLGIDLDNFETGDSKERDFAHLDDGSSTVRSHEDRLYDARANLDAEQERQMNIERQHNNRDRDKVLTQNQAARKKKPGHIAVFDTEMTPLSGNGSKLSASRNIPKTMKIGDNSARTNPTSRLKEVKDVPVDKSEDEYDDKDFD